MFYFNPWHLKMKVLEKSQRHQMLHRLNAEVTVRVSVFTLWTDIRGFLCAFENFTNPVVTFTGGSDTKRRSATGKDKLATCHSHHKGTDWQMYRKRVRWPNTHCHNAGRALLKTSTVVKDSYLLLLICVCSTHVLMECIQEFLSYEWVESVSHVNELNQITNNK